MPRTTPPIATARLDLVPLRVEDATEMVGVLGDPTLYHFIGGGPPTLADLARRYRVQIADRSGNGREEWHNWIVRERSTGAATGFVQATVVGSRLSVSGVTPARSDEATARGPLEAEIAWLIGSPWQGRGYASEAARGLVDWLTAAGVGAIVAHVHPDHHGSATVAGRAGLEPTEIVVDGERAWRRAAPPAAATAEAAAAAEPADPADPAG